MIIMLGMPRSGSTWIGKIFDSHPLTYYYHEPDTSTRLSMPLYPDISAWADFKPELDSFRDQLQGPLDLRVGGKTPLFDKAFHSRTGNLLCGARIWIAKLAGRAGLRVSLPPPPHGRAAVKIWKSIESLGRAGVIARAIPDAKVILLVRNPCANIASVLRGEKAREFSSLGAQSEDYGIFQELLSTKQAQRHGLTLSMLQELSPEERLAWRWLLINEKALDDTRELKNVSILRYEDVCEAPERCGRHLLESNGLQWSPQSQAFLAQSTSRTDERYYSVFKDPHAAANRWKQELSDEVIARVTNIVSNTRPGELYPELSNHRNLRSEKGVESSDRRKCD